MEARDRDALEIEVREHWDRGDRKRAATRLLEGYGREIFGFLGARLRDRDATSEVFSQFTEDLWKGLDRFRWQCSARAWAYTLARHATSRYVKDARRRRANNLPLSRAGPLSAIEQKSRTATLASARSETRNRFVELRESLPADDQMLLILRVNRQLDWREIAQVMYDEGDALTEDVLQKHAVRLRKRFQLAKDRLRRMALEKGLIAPDGDR